MKEFVYKVTLKLYDEMMNIDGISPAKEIAAIFETELRTHFEGDQSVPPKLIAKHE